MNIICMYIFIKMKDNKTKMIFCCFGYLCMYLASFQAVNFTNTVEFKDLEACLTEVQKKLEHPGHVA